MAEARVEHAQIGKHFGRRADGRTRAAVGEVLVNANGRGQSFDAVNRRLGRIRDEAERLHELPLALFVQRVERQR